ncbi:hypothetical protein CBR_g37848 [Chara braunii]|uniref:Reverse transcriptase domain-containing protein n=1 Tax=Chara braunii TaxID=69332 RepID=A0A388LNQ3_CHABU|nr:hypothetical protein CBR_g37848 [Chara braunii]|eukprot:GBG83976.1 hypothetical protein CBR_g37848 [Chara braunii]
MEDVQDELTEEEKEYLRRKDAEVASTKASLDSKKRKTFTDVRRNAFLPLASPRWVETMTNAFSGKIWALETYNFLAPIDERGYRLLASLSQDEMKAAYDRALEMNTIPPDVKFPFNGDGIFLPPMNSMDANKCGLPRPSVMVKGNKPPRNPSAFAELKRIWNVGRPYIKCRCTVEGRADCGTGPAWFDHLVWFLLYNLDVMYPDAPNPRMKMNLLIKCLSTCWKPLMLMSIAFGCVRGVMMLLGKRIIADPGLTTHTVLRGVLGSDRKAFKKCARLFLMAKYVKKRSRNAGGASSSGNKRARGEGQETVLVGDKLGEGMTHGIISLMFKKGDKANVRNYRSISLLNMDYKVLAKTLALRLGKILPRIVERDQGAFVQRRSIFLNILTAIESVEVLQVENRDMVVLLLDLEKAYDKVGWLFVLTTLRKMGFGEGFCRWVIAMYTAASSAVQVNEHLSEPFQLIQSLRQGCPLAPLLFVLQLEVPLNCIRKHRQIKGLPLAGGRECRAKALVDDLFLISENSLSSLLAVKAVLQEYSLLSEAQVNWNKSAYILPEGFALVVEWGMHRVVSADGERFLGVLISLELMSAAQGALIRQRIAARLKVWGSAWHLSLFGQTLVINSALFALLWFVARVREISRPVISGIKRLATRFLWKPRAGQEEGFFVKVAWDLVTQDKEEGGLGLVDPHRKNQAYLKEWLAKVALSEHTDDWLLLGERILAQEWQLTRLEDVWPCFFIGCFMRRKLKSEFWEGVRRAWVDHPPDRRTPPVTKEEVLRQCIFENPLITDEEGNELPANVAPGSFGKAWIQRGVTRTKVGDLWDSLLGSWKKGGEVYAKLQGLRNVEQDLGVVRQAIPQMWMRLLGPEGQDPVNTCSSGTTHHRYG